MLPLAIVFLVRTCETSIAAEAIETLSIAAHLVIWMLSVTAVAFVAAPILDSLFFGFIKLGISIFLLFLIL